MSSKTKYFMLFIILGILFSADLFFAQVVPPSLTAPADAALSIQINPTFTWSAVPSATQYRIQVSTDPTFATFIMNQTSNTNSYPSVNLAYNTTYYWKVQVTVGGVTSAFSSNRSFKTKPGVPVLTLPSSGAVGTAANVTLTWQPVTGADNYTLEVSTVSDFSSTVFSQSTLTTTSQAMTGLSNYRLYYWHVRATTTDGNTGDFSASRSFTTIQAPPVLTAPANNSLNYTHVKITYAWGAVTDATSYDLQVSKNSSFTAADTKAYYNLTTNTYTPVDYFDYNQQYYWRVRVKVGAIPSDYSANHTFTTGTPSSRISSSDANADIVFDHTAGRISEIVYKQGSNKQLLNTYFNEKNKTGLGRINSETGTKISSWSESGSTYVYNYDNTTYGSKTLTVSWDASGITVDLRINLDANKSAILKTAWQPGGDCGPIHDYILYADASDKPAKASITYPGLTTILYSGDALLTAMYDDRYATEEFFGYKSGSSVNTLIQQTTAFGPSFTYSPIGASRVIDLNFAIKNRADFFTWANKKYIVVNTPATGEKLLNQSTPTVTWDSYGVTGAVDINLSTTGAAPFGTSLSAATTDDGTETVTLPNLALPQNNCAIQVAGTGASGISGIFSLTAGTATVFSITNTLTSAPTAQVSVPILITPGTGASINAFDIRLTYNKDLLTFASSTSGAPLTGWVVDATNAPLSGYIQIGGFKNSGSAITAPGTLITLTFVIKSNARVGTQIPLIINNSYLSAADGSALPLTVTGTDGLLTLYSRISGRLHYINTNKTAITGADL